VPQVTVTIAGRSYRMACDEGQEDHLRSLGRLLDERIDGMRQSFGEIGEMRLTVMAAITLADDWSEMRRRIAALERQVAELAATDEAVSAERAAEADTVSSALGGVADRLEDLAATLNIRARGAEPTGATPMPRLD